MKFVTLLILLLIVIQPKSFSQELEKKVVPPYDGTIFIESDIINQDDHSTFQNVTYTGQGQREMFDRRVNNFVVYNAYLFDATFDDGLSAEIQVNPEFVNSDSARVEAERYGWYIGQLPTQLRKDMETVWIHKGTQPFGGGNNNILIHTGQSDLYLQSGILEETLIHEASHTSLDSYHSSSAGWLQAQTDDSDFISTYARDNSTREDVAETFLLYLAVTYRKERISTENYDKITTTIPNRIKYFDSQELDLYPITSTATSSELDRVLDGFTLHQNYPNPFNPSTKISYTLTEAAIVELQVFDLVGRNVATLENNRKPAGDHSVEFNAMGLPSGMYIYKIKAGSFTQTRKLMLIK